MGEITLLEEKKWGPNRLGSHVFGQNSKDILCSTLRRSFCVSVLGIITTAMYNCFVATKHVLIVWGFQPRKFPVLYYGHLR